MQRRAFLVSLAATLNSAAERLPANRNIKWAVSAGLWSHYPLSPINDILDVMRDTGFIGVRLIGFPGILKTYNLTAAQLEREVSKRNLNVVTISFGGPVHDPSQHSKVVENAKGLLDSIQVVGTQVGAQQESPSLTVGLGDIAPGQTADADFLITSTLQGLFINFSATYTHSDALGGLDTSLIQSVQTHTLIHAGDFNFPGNTGETDYLAEDVANVGDLPDTVYFSNGTTSAGLAPRLTHKSLTKL